MANQKISQLTDGSPAQSTDQIPINRAGANFRVNAGQFAYPLIAGTHTPSSATDTGTAGTIAWDANFVYICVSTNAWKRVAIAGGF